MCVLLTSGRYLVLLEAFWRLIVKEDLQRGEFPCGGSTLMRGAWIRGFREMTHCRNFSMSLQALRILLAD
jgi:hypothetical protein